MTAPGASSDVWRHLSETVLFEIITNTLWLALGVAGGAALLGVSLAALVVFFDFPGRKPLEYLLILPFAIPTYVLGFVWIGLLDYSAVFPTFLRQEWGFDLLRFFQVRSRAGIIIVMTLALYPYVYLLARNAFSTQGKSVWEAAVSLGLRPRNILRKVSIPMAKPWILAGVLLVTMETLADFGTVSVFNYDTFTTGIYKAWFGLFSLPAAAQLSSVLLTLVSVILVLEYGLSGKRKIYALAPGYKQNDKLIVLKGPWMSLAILYPVGVFLLAFMIPMIQLIFWSAEIIRTDLDVRYLRFFSNTLFLSALAAAAACMVSMLLAYAGRRHPGKLMPVLNRLATLGYAVPGTVLAVGIFTAFLRLDEGLNAVLSVVANIESKRFLSGSVAALIFAYLIRFLAVAHKPVESAVQRVTHQFDEVGRSMGVRGIRLVRKVHIPMIKGGVVTAFLLVFVDVMKEMPITLMMRPYGWETLAVRIFEMTSEGEWQRAALPAVILVAAGFIPAALLLRESQPGRGK